MTYRTAFLLKEFVVASLIIVPELRLALTLAAMFSSRFNLSHSHISCCFVIVFNMNQRSFPLAPSFSFLIFCIKFGYVFCLISLLLLSCQIICAAPLWHFILCSILLCKDSYPHPSASMKTTPCQVSAIADSQHCRSYILSASLTQNSPSLKRIQLHQLCEWIQDVSFRFFPLCLIVLNISRVLQLDAATVWCLSSNAVCSGSTNHGQALKIQMFKKT